MSNWHLPVEPMKAAIERHHESEAEQQRLSAEAYELAWQVFTKELATALARNKFPVKVPTKGLSSAQIEAARIQLNEAGFEVRDEIDDDGPLMYLIAFVISIPPKK